MTKRQIPTCDYEVLRLLSDRPWDYVDQNDRYKDLQGMPTGREPKNG